MTNNGITMQQILEFGIGHCYMMAVGVGKLFILFVRFFVAENNKM